MKRIPLNTSTFGDEETNAVLEVLRSNRVTMGGKCQEFERAFGEYLGGAEAIFVGCGECIVRGGGGRADGGVHELCYSGGAESSGRWGEHAADGRCDDQFAQLQSGCVGDGVSGGLTRF